MRVYHESHHINLHNLEGLDEELGQQHPHDLLCTNFPPDPGAGGVHRDRPTINLCAAKHQASALLPGGLNLTFSFGWMAALLHFFTAVRANLPFILKGSATLLARVNDRSRHRGRNFSRRCSRNINNLRLAQAS